MFTTRLMSQIQFIDKLISKQAKRVAHTLISERKHNLSLGRNECGPSHDCEAKYDLTRAGRGSDQATIVKQSMTQQGHATGQPNP